MTLLPPGRYFGPTTRGAVSYFPEGFGSTSGIKTWTREFQGSGEALRVIQRSIRSIESTLPLRVRKEAEAWLNDPRAYHETLKAIVVTPYWSLAFGDETRGLIAVIDNRWPRPKQLEGLIPGACPAHGLLREECTANCNLDNVPMLEGTDAQSLK